MTTEQVNVQELQRLNEAITLTIDAIRRTAPQLSQLQQQVLLGGITPNVFGYGAAAQPGVPGFGIGVDPLTAYLHAQQAMMRGFSPLGPVGGFGVQGMSPLAPFSPFGYGALHPGAAIAGWPTTFGSPGVPTPWSQPYGYGQRAF